VAEALSQVVPVRIEPLAKGHDRRAFSCGVEALDLYLSRFARQHADANISRTYVAMSGSTVHGFYSLAVSGIRRENLPEKCLNRFPKLPLPVARLARLAVDLNHQRQGLGELLLADALQRCLHISESIGMLGVIVDAKDERARGWYERYEFERLPDSPLTLWLPTAAIPRT
jgi:GNAT superfamily N-acetyltransferase